MVSLQDYNEAFNAYKRLTSNFPGIDDIVQCGTVKNPGISDIDTILIIDNWNSFKPSIQLLNPERISPLFTHGPFICEKSSLIKLSQFSTLRIQNSNYSNLYSTKVDNASLLAITLIRQTRSFLHFNSIKKRLFDLEDRQILLLANSLKHSLSDLQGVELLQESGKYVFFLEILNKLNFIMIKGVSLNKYDINILINHMHEHIELGIEILSSALAEQLSMCKIDYGARKRAGLLSWFLTNINRDEFYFNNQDNNIFINTIYKWNKFYNDMVDGHNKSGAFAKGAEFIFMNHKISRYQLFSRRLIKRSNRIFRLSLAI